MRPLGPHRRERLVQRRQAPGLDRAFARPVVIGTARGEEPMLQRHALPHRVLLGTVAAGDDLDRVEPSLRFEPRQDISDEVDPESRRRVQERVGFRAGCCRQGSPEL